MTAYSTQIVGKRNIQYLKTGKGQPLLFLHGFGIKPHFYDEMIDDLAKDFEVIAPTLYGINYLDDQPTTLEDLTELTDDFCNDLKLGKRYTMGHSTGGGVAFLYAAKEKSNKKVIGINPLMPTDLNPFEYGWRAFAGSISDSRIRNLDDAVMKLKMQGKLLRLTLPYIANILKKPLKTYDLVADIGKFDYGDMKITQPSMLLFGEVDKFFEMDDGVEKKIRKSFKKIKIKRLEKMVHEWPLYHGNKAADEVRDFFKRRKIFKKRKK